MSRREDIDNAIWTDPDFEALSPDATLLFLWSWTNLRCGMAGLYKVSVRAMAESKVPAEAVPAALEELTIAGFAFYEDSVIWVRSRVKHLRSRSPQMARSIANDVLKVAVDHPLRGRFLDEYASHPWLRDELKRPYVEGGGNLSKNPVDKPDSYTLRRTSREVPGTGEGQGTSGTGLVEGVDAQALPANFPDELRPHHQAAFRVLLDLAERHGAKAITPLSLASVLMGRPRKPLVRAAFDFTAWADGQAQRRKDVVSGYRNWLDKTNDLAAVEAISAGLPAGASLSHGQVVPLHPTIARANAWQAGYPDGGS